MRYEVYDEDGNLIEDDDIVRDGATVRVTFMDSNSILPSRRGLVLDGNGDDGIPAAVRRFYGKPAAADLRDAAANAYDERNKRLNDAWKHKPASVAKENTRDAKQGGDRITLDDDVRNVSLDDLRARAADAIAERNARLSNAWRRP
jgi:hypothetical protein